MVFRGIGHASFSDAELLFGNLVPQTVLSVRAWYESILAICSCGYKMGNVQDISNALAFVSLG